MQIDNSSTIVHKASIKIEAPAQKVWDLMADIENWPSWNKDVESATLNGKLTKGTTFTWKSGPGTITSTLQEVSGPHLIGWSGKLFGITAVHIWRIESRGRSSLVTTEESWDGFFPKLFKRYSKKVLREAIDSGLQQLKTAAENSEK